MPDPTMIPPATGAAPMAMPVQGDVPPEGEAQVSDMKRPGDYNEPESDKALVKKLQGWVKGAKTYHKDAFERMRKDMKFLSGDQWDDGVDGDKYVANITLRQVNQHVAALYAKNPRIVCRRRPTIDYAVWDESAAGLLSIQTAMTQAAASGMPVDPQIQALLADVVQGSQKKQLLNRVARSLEIVFKHTLTEQLPPFKTQMKQLVRRTCATAVGFVKLGFQRAMQPRPEDVDKVRDITTRIAAIERILADVADGELEEERAEKAELEQMILALQQEPQIIVSEGLVFDFPMATSIIIDPKCTQLSGFLGAQWVAQEYLLSRDDVKEIYKVDLGDNFTQYTDPDSPGERDQKIKEAVQGGEDTKPKGRICVWEIYHKTSGLCYVVADGYCDFLKAPESPTVRLHRFWPFFTLCFNQIENENEKGLYPQSDVALMRPIQKEYNRSRESLRQHRNANRPKTMVARGALDEKDKDMLVDHPANAVIELNALQPGQDVKELLQPFVGPPIDPALYDTAHLFDDVQRVSGAAEANLGGTSGATATESSIAEASRSSGLSSNVDELDDLLTELAQSGGQVLLSELTAETVKRIAGAGAAWPDVEQSRAEISQELILEIEAGSSGRPNRAAEIGNFERMAPILMQIPGISPDWFAKEAIKRTDDKMDIAEALMAGAQSIVSMNANAQVSTGNPATDPNQQGPQGGQNTPKPEGGPSPMQQDTGPTPNGPAAHLRVMNPPA